MSGELIAIGEALIDFIPSQRGCDADEAESFCPKCGGAPANVCAAFTVLGGKSKLITQLGDDMFGKRIVRELDECGVDTSCISVTDRANTALAFVSLAEDGNRSFSFYRKPSADMLLESDAIKGEWFEKAFALHFCSVSLGNFPMKQAHIAAVDLARKHGALISFDPNLRLALWDNAEDLRKAVKEFIPKADLVKVSDEELEFITGEKEIRKALPKLFVGCVKAVVYTCGKDGAYVFTKEISCYSPASKVKAKDTTGAGDGFIGSFLYALASFNVTAENITDTKLGIWQKALDLANRFSGESVQHEGAISSYRKIVN